jgi:hypothetical protein
MSEVNLDGRRTSRILMDRNTLLLIATTIVIALLVAGRFRPRLPLRPRQQLITIPEQTPPAIPPEQTLPVPVPAQ